MLTTNEKIRYSRQLVLPGFGSDAQEKLKAAKVLVIGAGGLGCSVLSALASAGIGTIGIMDNDKVELHNLQRQLLFSESDLGKNKAFAARQKLSQMNSGVIVNAFDDRFHLHNSQSIVSRFDVVVDCSDNMDTRFLINDCCVTSGVPFVYGAVYQFEGQLAVFNHEGGPSLRDFFAEEGNVAGCTSTGVLNTLPGIVGMLQANEVIKIITGCGEVCSGKMFVIDILRNSIMEIEAQLQ